MTELPRDDRLIPMPVLSPRSGGAHHLESETDVSTRNATAFATGVKVILVTATEPAYVRLGDATVSATAADHYLPAGVPLYLALRNQTNLAVKAGSAAGIVHVSEMV